MSLLSLQGVSKRRGGRPVLDGLGFEVARGEAFGLLGPNGCGKSTALNIVAGLLDADSGAAFIDGQPLGAATQRQLGLCPQHTALYRDLRPAENLDFFARLHGLRPARRRDRVDELMALFQLQPHAGTVAGQLSGGWQQRLNLAVALVQGPQLLVLDEPTSAVDLQARHELWALIEGLRVGGLTVLLCTHHLAEAERLCSRVGLMKNGRLAAVGTLAELRARVPAQAVATLRTGDEAAARARAAQRGWATRRYAGELACLLPHETTLREVVEAFDGVEVSAVSVVPVALEHAYLEVMQEAAA
jgi:ABC-2 type transport system ATP-binding protein